MSYIIWTAIFIAALVVEASTVSLVSIWFAVGSLASLISAWFGLDIVWQIVIFVATSAITLIIARPIIKKNIKSKAIPTNADMTIGKTAIVTKEIKPGSFAGEVNADGKIWSAISGDNTAICEGETVNVKEIKGVRLVVEKIK